MQASPLPTTNDFDFAENAVTSAGRYPISGHLDLRRASRSADVNSMDQVPNSTWYNARLGYTDISPNDLLQGPISIGAPQKPITVIKTKKIGDSKGFIVKDSKGNKYLIKFDPAEYPLLQTTNNLVVNRLFWGFGFNVPEDFIFYFKRNDLNVDSNINESDVDSLLFEVGADKTGQYRTTASLLIEGTVLGGTHQKGVRKGDLNDRVPHENLRSLRSLRVFCAWLDHTGMRTDNSLDVYTGTAGNGYTKHYLLDFGETLGAHGVEKGRPWDGHEHYFSLKDSIIKFAELGLFVQPWENRDPKSSTPKDYYQVENFSFEKWKESLPFQPIQKSQPDDDYWAVKILASVTREHLETLFNATNNPQKEYLNYLIETLVSRKQIILNEVLSSVSPVESTGITNGELQITNMGQKILGGLDNISYKINFYNEKNKKISETLLLENQSTNFSIPINTSSNYLRVDVRVWKNGKKAPRSAEFHIRNNKLVGVVH